MPYNEIPNDPIKLRHDLKHKVQPPPTAKPLKPLTEQRLREIAARSGRLRKGMAVTPEPHLRLLLLEFFLYVEVANGTCSDVPFVKHMLDKGWRVADLGPAMVTLIDRGCIDPFKPGALQQTYPGDHRESQRDRQARLRRAEEEAVREAREARRLEQGVGPGDPVVWGDDDDKASGT